MADKKTKKMVRVHFTGKELLEDKVFDTTRAEDAKTHQIFDEKRKYGPMTVITGEKELLGKVESALEEMKEGEQKVIKLLASEAFGERLNDLIRVVPLKNFLDQKINPFPGLVVRVADAIGKVQSVSSGRVRIDFNHPLAGRDVEYNVELVKEIKDNKEIADAVFDKYYSRIPGAKKEVGEGTLTITLSPNLMKNLDAINNAVKGIVKELGIELKFKEDDSETSQKEVSSEGTTADEEIMDEEKTEHVHGPNCNHEHVHIHEEKPHPKMIDGDAVSEERQKTKSIHALADEIKKEKKSGSNFDVTKDSSTTIQRPKKK
ncbi:MAG: FKBP-type peptidyl-prolyl cis-trans isomerase [archaeon]|jgi:FKBP-type peptidyl-prolyl cis-trans isomerase 2